MKGRIHLSNLVHGTDSQTPKADRKPPPHKHILSYAVLFKNEDKKMFQLSLHVIFNFQTNLACIFIIIFSIIFYCFSKTQ